MRAPTESSERRTRRAVLRRALSRLSVSGRLIGAITVPILLLIAVSVGVTNARQNQVQLASHVVEELRIIDQLVSLRSAVFAERLAAELLVPALRPPDDVLRTTDFGTRIVEDPAELSQRTDAALAALAVEHRPFDAADLEATRVEQERRPGDLDSLTLELGSFYDLTGEALWEHVEAIRGSSVALGDDHLIDVGTSFHRSVEVPAMAGEMVAALADLWIADPENRLGRQSNLAALVARFEDASARFAPTISDPGGPVGRFWGQLQIPDGLRIVLDEAIAGGLSSPERPAMEPVGVGLIAMESLDWLMEVRELPLVTSGVTAGVAAQVAAEARREELTTAVLLLVTIGVSVAAAMLMARSIILPVLQLTDQARQVGRGRLDIEHLELRGPPEVVLAGRAFNDVVDTLVLLERKSHALAECDFDHPVLREPLPGMLGAELQRSVRVLSGSIVEREELQSRLVHEATHDALTGLANRAALVEKLTSTQQRPAAGRPQVAVLFIDLNDFKRANDRYGHAVGDELLRAVARRMSATVPSRCTVARFGGDEFVAVLPGVEDPREPVALAHELVRAISEPVDLDGLVLGVGASAGVAVSAGGDGPDQNPLDLLRRADLAVYSAKRSTSRSVVLYDEEFDRLVSEQEDVEEALAAALSPDADELRLVFQPIIATGSGELYGVESLVRWDRPGYGRVPPDAFVPIAERSGLIVELDRWVVRTAIRQLQHWREAGELRGVPVSVNISGRSLLDPYFVGHVTAELGRTPVPPGQLKVEITETALVTDLELAAARLTEMRDLGVRIVIDDFGTGYTSVAHLRSLPVDELKIDGSFVQRLPDEEHRVLIQMIHQLAHHLDIATVAEGVETAEQIRYLREIGCDFLQGYLFSRPLDHDELTRWVHARLLGARDASPLPAGDVVSSGVS